MDLVRIAAYAYSADQMVSRGGPSDIYGRDWRREFILCAPVSDPDFWAASAVRDALQETLGFVSDDVWRFHFTKAAFEEQLGLQTDLKGPRRDPDTVVSLSGGADSLCAVVEAVARNNSKPVLVSHRPAPNIDHRQKALVQELRERFPGWHFPHTSVWVNRMRSEAMESSQRSRSFLFASLAAAVASAIGISNVILADNGIVSLNLPINGQLVGALASRSTHPRFIELFNKLSELVLPSKPRVTNPLWARTRAEGFGELKKAGVGELLQETFSCSRGRGLTRAAPHCGVCSQCVDRRFGSLAAGLEGFDLSECYATDIFREALTGDAKTVAESYVRFARNVDGMTDDELFGAYPELNACILSSDPTPAKTAGQLTDMLRRHASATLDVLSSQLKVSGPDFVKHKLPSTCLLHLATIRKAPGPAKPDLPAIELSSADEEQILQHRLKSRLRIRITGQTEGRKSNVVQVDDAEVVLPDSQFRLFLRLVVGVFETVDGFVELKLLGTPGDLNSEEPFLPEGLDQMISRVRARFRPALKELKATQFIEVQRRRMRVSTHRRYVAVDADKLLKHPDHIIRALAARLG